MACSAPSSVTVKSFAVSPSTGLPLLSFTFTVSTTNWLLVEKVEGVSAPAGAFSPIFWASNGRAAARIIKRMVSGARIILEPQYESCCQTAHGIGGHGKAKLRAAERGDPARVGDVVDGVGGIDPQIATQPVAQAEGAPSRGVQSELQGTRNGVPSGVAEFTGKRRGISGGIQGQARRCVVNGRAGVIRPKRARDSRGRDGRLVRRRERQSAAGRDGGRQHPSLEQRAPPTVEQRSSGQAHAGGVLNCRAQKMPLIEGREAALRAQVQPILRHQEVAWA